MTGSASPAFARYIGIDYSGAATPRSSLKGLRVYLADRTTLPEEVLPPPSPRKYWTRRGIAEWLAERLAEDSPTLVGIDHGFSFPLRYFEAHHLPHDWPAFLDDFQRHWPFDGWQIPAGRSAVAEVYPALWKHAFAQDGLTPDQHDAYAVAAWLRQADLDGRLQGFLAPTLTPPERAVAEVEGWILGVG